MAISLRGRGPRNSPRRGAEDRLRDRQDEEKSGPATVLAATDPANPYGAALKWPETSDEAARPQRSVGARVILHDGRLLGQLNRNVTRLLTFLPPNEPERSVSAGALIQALAGVATGSAPIYLQVIDGQPARESPLAKQLADAGFVALRDGFVHRGDRVQSRESRVDRRSDA